MQPIEEILRTKKIKVTPQRMAVYSILKETKAHPNVEMIYQKLKPEYPAMSLATVYKTVDVLKKVGLIQELNVGEGGLRYDATVKPHAHAYCKSCGKVKDVDFFPLEQFEDDALINNVQEKIGFDVSSIQLYFFGLCSSCREEKL